MKTILSALLALSVLTGTVVSASAAEEQRDARTFDDSKYFEHDSTKIPTGTLEWWNQKADEGR